MSKAFDIAKEFFHACEKPLGWQACRKFATSDATFKAQSEPIAEITSLDAYCDWMHAFGTITAMGSSYTLHFQAWDEEQRTGLFYATFHGTHVGAGGPVEPTGKSTDSDYVYAITLNDDDKVVHMTKIWNAPWAMAELGWV